MRKAVNKPTKTVVEHSYYKICHKCNIDIVKEKLKEKSEFLRDTIISIFIFLTMLTLKNDVLRNDIVSFVMLLWNGILLIGEEVINFANDVSIFVYKIENETIAVILYWIIKILVILLLVALIAVICYLTVYLYKAIFKYKYGFSDYNHYFYRNSGKRILYKEKQVLGGNLYEKRYSKQH